MHLGPVECCGQVSIPAASTVVSNVRSLAREHRLTPVALESTRSFIDRASWKTVNKVTVKKMMKIFREIKDIAKKKLFSARWTSDRVERIGGWGIMTSSLSAEVPADRLSDFGVPGPGVRSLGSPGWLGDVVWSVEGTAPCSCSLLSMFELSKFVKKIAKTEAAPGII